MAEGGCLRISESGKGFLRIVRFGRLTEQTTWLLRSLLKLRFYDPVVRSK